MKKLSLLLSIFLIGLFSLTYADATPPVWTSPIPDQTISVNSAETLFDSNLTTPPGAAENLDRDLNLTFSIQSEDTTKVDCRINGVQLYGTPATGFTGTTTCTVRASDNTEFADDTFTITVTQSQQTLEVTGKSIQGSIMAISSTKDYDADRIITLKNTGNTSLTLPANAITTFGIFK